MKKIFLLNLVVVLTILFVFVYTSCKKPVHSLQPTPNNIRLMSYTATTQRSTSSANDTTNDNYTFFYDGNNRVSQILYTSNNPTVVAAGRNNERITFYYSNDTIIKTIAANGGTPISVFEIDTLIINTATNQITTIYTPGMINQYQYYENLMSIETDEYYNKYHGVTTVTDSRTYTSQAGNFLASAFTGILNVTFPSTMTISPYPMRDYWLQIPNLPSVAPNLSDVDVAGLKGTVHTALRTYTDQLDYTTSGIPLLIFAKDTANDTCYVDFPGNIWPSQAYAFYTNDANRIGDYLQLQSFTLWGINLYQNANLVKSIINSGYSTNITYNINSYSEIPQMTATIVDSLANTQRITYNLQYETY